MSIQQIQQFQFRKGGMSASLPRIKTVSEMAKQNNPDSQKDLKVKFRRLTLDEPEIEQRKRSIKSIKTSRLNSLERYTTIQEQREFKNEKIHLNLIERKLLNGTYDEKKQTSLELNGLKQKRDQMRVDMVNKQKEIERIKVLLDDVRQETVGFLSKKGQHDEKLNELKEKSDSQQLKAEYARENKSVLENMIKVREEINIVLSKRHHSFKDELLHLKSGQALLDTELRQLTEKCAIHQAKLENLLKQSIRQRQDRNDQISKHQQKINKRKEGEVVQAEKSKKYIAHLDDVERKVEVKQFHQVYDKILANIFIARYVKMKMLDLRERYEKYEDSYNTVKASRSFDISTPATFVSRFFQHQPENVKIQQQIELKENIITNLETDIAEKKRRLQELSTQSDQIDECFDLGHHAQIMTKERENISNLKHEVEQIDEKNVRIKTNILRLMKQLNQKGDKRIYNGSQATVNNLSILTTVLKEAYRQIN